MDADWECRAGDRITRRSLAAAARSRSPRSGARFSEVAGELRGYLTVVPESRWIKHADHQNWFFDETTEHYEDHCRDLAAILEAAR